MSVRMNAIFVAALACAATLNFPTAQAAVKVHKVVIQISNDNAKQHELALSNTVNLQTHYGIDNVIIEVVAFGPGISILTKKSALSQRIESLSMQEVTFYACTITLNALEAKAGKKVELSKGVKSTPSGVARIVELQEQGFSYLRP